MEDEPPCQGGRAMYLAREGHGRPPRAKRLERGPTSLQGGRATQLAREGGRALCASLGVEPGGRLTPMLCMGVEAAQRARGARSLQGEGDQPPEGGRAGAAGEGGRAASEASSKGAKRLKTLNPKP